MVGAFKLVIDESNFHCGRARPLHEWDSSTGVVSSYLFVTIHKPAPPPPIPEGAQIIHEIIFINNSFTDILHV